MKRLKVAKKMKKRAEFFIVDRSAPKLSNNDLTNVRILLLIDLNSFKIVHEDVNWVKTLR